MGKPANDDLADYGKEKETSAQAEPAVENEGASQAPAEEASNSPTAEAKKEGE